MTHKNRIKLLVTDLIRDQGFPTLKSLHLTF